MKYNWTILYNLCVSYIQLWKLYYTQFLSSPIYDKVIYANREHKCVGVRSVKQLSIIMCKFSYLIICFFVDKDFSETTNTCNWHALLLYENTITVIGLTQSTGSVCAGSMKYRLGTRVSSCCIVSAASLCSRGFLIGSLWQFPQSPGCSLFQIYYFFKAFGSFFSWFPDLILSRL